MAQTGYTPLLIYSSTTGGAAPAAGNLTNSTLGSELAINITDGKLFYKDNANAVQVIGWKTTPTTAGGTGLTSYTAGDLLYYASGTTLTKLSVGAANTVLTSSGTAPQWSTSITLSGDATAAAFIPSGSTVPTNGMYLSAANTLAWSTNTTYRMSVTSTGEVLVGGTTSVDAKPGAISVESTTGGDLNLIRNDTTVVAAESLGEVSFWGNDTTSNTRTKLAYVQGAASGTHAAGDNPTDIVFGTTPDGTGTIAEAGRITQSGAYVLKGGSTALEAGVGIIFPASQVASANANCLDDYEEGTWTPVVVGSTTAGTGTYSSQLGYYTKIGNIVRFTLNVWWTAHTGTGNIRVSLPFTPASDTDYSVHPAVGVDLTIPADMALTSMTYGGIANLILYTINTTSPTNPNALAMDTSARLYISGTYQT